VKLVEEFEKGGDCADLTRIIAEYPLTHVITEADQVYTECSHFEKLYSDQSYTLFRLK
jgi:hypothetical protein